MCGHAKKDPDLSRPEEAEASYRQAISLKPDYAEAHYNLGVAIQDLGRPKKQRPATDKP